MSRDGRPAGPARRPPGPPRTPRAGARRAPAVSPARRVAYDVLRRVFEQGAYADRALAGEARRRGLDGRDRALATRLAFGAVQRRATLDHVIARLARRPVERLQPPVLAALRLGLLQLLYLGGIPDHAAVAQSVELAKSGAGPGAPGLVNAVLRRAAREGPALVAGLDDSTPAGAALAHSVPEWLARMWWDELGEAEARALLATVNRPAESAVRVNSLVADRDAVAAGLGVVARPDPELPHALVLDGPLDLEGSQAWRDGLLMAQSRASQLAAALLAPQPGERVLDLCAAPGAKTTHLAALMGGQGEIVAVERHAGRAAALRRTVRRMRAANVTVVVGDAARPPVPGAFDRVLVDPPCSGLGTLQSRPDLRWRASPEAIAALAARQASILAAGVEALRPGGTLVYSVCTISRAEGEERVAGALAARADLELRHVRRTLPHRDGTDGFHLARLGRVSL